MSENLFLIIIYAIGFFSSILQIFVIYSCFSLTSIVLNKNAVGSGVLGFKHLLCYVAATLISGAVFIALILLVVHWTNNFPELASGKRFYWIGFMCGLLFFRLFVNWKWRIK